MSDRGPVDSLLELADEQIEQQRPWAAFVRLMGAYGRSPGNPEIVARICNLLAEHENVQSAASFVLRDDSRRTRRSRRPRPSPWPSPSDTTNLNEDQSMRWRFEDTINYF